MAKENGRDYRQGRIPVSETIQREVIRLIVREKDTEKKKRHPTKWYRAEVAKEYKLKEEDNPSLRSYEELVKKYKKRLRETSPMDKQWSLGNYMRLELEKDFKLTPEDNLEILKVRNMQLKRANSISINLSVRQALWIARLSAIIKHIPMPQNEEYKGKDKAYLLWESSFMYAVCEKVCIVRGDDFHTREIDDALLEGYEKFKETYEKRAFTNWKDFEPYYLSHFLNGYPKHKKDGER